MPAKTMGILAGMGPRSTAPFVDLVVTECQRQYGAKADSDFPPMMIYSLPAPFYLDRPLDHQALAATITAGLQRLASTGVALIALPCNTAHIYYTQLAQSIQIPLLNMIEIAVQNLPPSARRVALVATRPTSDAGLYQKMLQQTKVELARDESWQRRIDTLLQTIKTTQDLLAAQAQWLALLQIYEVAGVDTVMIACTDINAIQTHYPGKLTLVDATQCLAATLVSRWRALA